MAFRKHVMITVVLLCISGLLLGCSDDGTVAPIESTYEAPLAAPSGLKVALTADGDISLRWSPSTQPNLGGYNIYRRVVSQYAVGQLNEAVVTATNFTDTNVNLGIVYEYRVTAVSVRGSESAYTSVEINTHTTGGKKIKREDL